MRLLLEGEDTEKQRMEMLNRRRGIALDEIHFREKQLDPAGLFKNLRFRMKKRETGQ